MTLDSRRISRKLPTHQFFGAEGWAPQTTLLRQATVEYFFDVEENPLITFKLTRTVQNPTPMRCNGDSTIRGVSNPEKLMLTVSGKGTGSGEQWSSTGRTTE